MRPSNFHTGAAVGPVFVLFLIGSPPAAGVRLFPRSPLTTTLPAFIETAVGTASTPLRAELTAIFPKQRWAQSCVRQGFSKGMAEKLPSLGGGKAPQYEAKPRSRGPRPRDAAFQGGWAGLRPTGRPSRPLGASPLSARLAQNSLSYINVA